MLSYGKAGVYELRLSFSVVRNTFLIITSIDMACKKFHMTVGSYAFVTVAYDMILICGVGSHDIYCKGVSLVIVNGVLDLLTLLLTIQLNNNMLMCLFCL